MLTASSTKIVKADTAYRNCTAVYHPAHLSSAEKHDISESVDSLHALPSFMQGTKKSSDHII